MISRLYERTGPIGFENICKNEVLSPNSGSRSDYLKIGSIEVGNSSGGDAKLGWGYLLPTVMWGAGQWDDSANASFTDDSTDAQSTTANDFALTTTTNDDGFIVEADVVFNMVGITVGTAAAGGSPAYAYEYWDGSSWANLEPFMIETPDFGNAADTYVGFIKPHDWTAFASGDAPVDTDGCTAGRYGIKVDASTAPSSTAALADKLWLVRIMDYVEAVSDGKSITFSAQGESRIPFKTSIVPYCSTANSLNWINIEYRQGG